MTTRVLLVEDNLANQQIAQMMLEALDCEVDIANDGFEALELSQNTYDLIFMDIGLPRMDGIEVSTTIRQREGNSNHTPIIALTAHATRADIEKYFQAGMDEVITKPLFHDQLTEVIKRFAQQKAVA